MPNQYNVYERDKAVAYAHKWAFARNPSYYDFQLLGGDCTNFASQVLHAGGKPMDYTKTFGWYFTDLNRRTPSWSGVQFLYNFLTRPKSPYAERTGMKGIMYGDLIQLSFFSDVFSHTLVIVETSDDPHPDNILIATHSDDSDYRPLSTYSYADIRFLHIL